jgi:hypothetical protein
MAKQNLLNDKYASSRFNKFAVDYSLDDWLKSVPGTLETRAGPTATLNEDGPICVPDDSFTGL